LNEIFRIDDCVVAADEKEVRVADEATTSDFAEGLAEPCKASEEEDTCA
jgi:Ran-binding protein 1